MKVGPEIRPTSPPRGRGWRLSLLFGLGSAAAHAAAFAALLGLADRRPAPEPMAGAVVAMLFIDGTGEAAEDAPQAESASRAALQPATAAPAPDPVAAAQTAVPEPVLPKRPSERPSVEPAEPPLSDPPPDPRLSDPRLSDPSPAAPLPDPPSADVPSPPQAAVEPPAVEPVAEAAVRPARKLPPPAPVARTAPPPSEITPERTATTTRSGPATPVPEHTARTEPGVVMAATNADAAAGDSRPAAFTGPGLSNPQPSYPPRARRLGIEGRVVLRVTVSADGRPLATEIAASSGSRLLDAEAAETVRAWRFVPAQRGRRAIVGTIDVPITFDLQDG